MMLRMDKRDADDVLIHLGVIDSRLNRIREILSDAVIIEQDSSHPSKKTPTTAPPRNLLNPSEATPRDIDVSQIQLYQKDRELADANSLWGWTFSRDRAGEYHLDSKELVQAIEQYGPIEVDGRIWSLGGRGDSLLQMREKK